MTPGTAEARERISRHVLRVGRAVFFAMVLGVLLLTVAAPWAPRVPGLEFLVVPAAVTGAVAPVIGYRLVRLLRERRAAEERFETRCRTYLRAHVAALAVTEGAALAGLAVAACTDRVLPLIGVLTHVLLAGAIWPTPERLELFVEVPGRAAAE